MCIITLLLPALHTVIFPDPGMEYIFIDPQVAVGLCHRLLRCNGKLHGALFACGRIAFQRWFTHRTPLSRVTIARVSVCPEEYSHFKIRVRRCRGTSDRCDDQHVRWQWQRSWLGVDLRRLLTDLACIDDELERIRVLMLFHQLEIGEPFRRSESAAVRQPCFCSVEQAGCHGVLAIRHETLR